MKTQVEEKFSDFYAKWMAQLEDLLQLLLLLVSRGRGPQADNQQAAYEALVNKLTAHHKEYYTFKWAAAREDVLAFFSPVWLTPLENTCLWITGWKPSMAFRLVDSMMKVQPRAAAAVCLSEEQVKKIRALRAKIKMEEEKVEREMERQHVAVADPKMVELVRLQMRTKKSGGAASVAVTTNQVNGLVEVALKGTLAGLERVMKMADCARLKTLKGLLEILNPMQSVGFLASKSMLQIRMRKLGKIREQKYRNNMHDHKENKYVDV